MSYITLVVVAVTWLAVRDRYGKPYCNIPTSGRIRGKKGEKEQKIYLRSGIW
jgi:hypothetical protein